MLLCFALTTLLGCRILKNWILTSLWLNKLNSWKKKRRNFRNVWRIRRKRYRVGRVQSAVCTTDTLESVCEPLYWHILIQHIENIDVENAVVWNWKKVNGLKTSRVSGVHAQTCSNWWNWFANGPLNCMWTESYVNKLGRLIMGKSSEKMKHPQKVRLLQRS